MVAPKARRGNHPLAGRLTNGTRGAIEPGPRAGNQFLSHPGLRSLVLTTEGGFQVFLGHGWSDAGPVMVAGEFDDREEATVGVIEFDVSLGSFPMSGPQSGAEPREQSEGAS